MNNREYMIKRDILIEKISFNKKIHCERVAARYERELKRLEDERRFKR